MRTVFECDACGAPSGAWHRPGCWIENDAKTGRRPLTNQERCVRLFTIGEVRFCIALAAVLGFLIGL